MNDKSEAELWPAIGTSLEFLYPGRANELLPRIKDLFAQFKGKYQNIDVKPAVFTSNDSIIITYPDMVSQTGDKPLKALKSFMDNHLSGIFTHIHVLPFFPSSSDEGFSVMDFHSVDSQYGNWSDIEGLGEHFKVIFDLVLNHASAKGTWFQSFLRQVPPFDHFFVTRPQDLDTTQVFRPRTHPLLTPQFLHSGKKVFLWTTFSPDQVDLDFSNPEVLLAMVEVLLNYLGHGAKILRLDAVAFAWKLENTNCLDLPQVHHLVKLFRQVLENVAPGVSLLSETNLPQTINDSYFGHDDEAQMVYRFTLPPLVLHAFIQGSVHYLTSWASGLPTPDPRRTYVNFLSSHDGIGVTPARDILPPEELDALIEGVKNRGGVVSYRSSPGGPVAYELNTTFLSAIAEPSEPEDLRVRAFLSAHALMVSLDGVPAFWFHSMMGSLNWAQGPKLTGSNRSIHRQRLDAIELADSINDSHSLRSKVFTGLKTLLGNRSSRRAFDPGSSQRIINQSNSVFALVRGIGENAVLTLVNVSDQPREIPIPKTFGPAGVPFDPTGLKKDFQPLDQNRVITIIAKGVVWIDGTFQGEL